VKESRNDARIVPPLRGADYARAAAYLSLVGWGIAFLLFPPVAFVSALDAGTRVFWISVTILGAIGAFVGTLTRLDLKLELGSLYPLVAGPGFYALSQAYYVFVPQLDANGNPSDPTQRIALTFFALFAFFLSLMQLLELRHRRKQTRLARTTSEAIETLTEAQQAQPGAFPDVDLDIERGRSRADGTPGTSRSQ
jgi:hypothetical protein